MSDPARYFTPDPKTGFNFDLYSSVYFGIVDDVRRCVADGVDLNQDMHGLRALHIAVGRNHVEIVRILLDAGVHVVPDIHGRWPSIVALVCNSDDAICDLVEEAESRLEME